MKIGIVIGSIREGRLGEGVGRWVEAAVAELFDPGAILNPGKVLHGSIVR